VADDADPLLFAFGSIWVGHYREQVLERIDPATNRVVARLRTGYSPIDLVAAFGSVWTADYDGNDLSRV